MKINMGLTYLLFYVSFFGRLLKSKKITGSKWMDILPYAAKYNIYQFDSKI